MKQFVLYEKFGNKCLKILKCTKQKQGRELQPNPLIMKLKGKMKSAIQPKLIYTPEG
jgi:hypothetical protein